MSSAFDPPIIASDIWSPSLLDSSQDTQNPSQHKCSTGSKALDGAFEGGFKLGNVHCITSKAEHGAQDFLLALLAAHLLRGTTSTATVIDSTLTFDVRRLHHAVQSSVADGGDAMEPLGRLKISKVFDRVGMVEAIAELSEALQSETGVERPFAPTPVIEDSEDEEEEVLLLDDSAAGHNPTESAKSARLLIINNISHVMSPVIKNDFTQGQALLTALMHSIYDVTKRHNLCTVVFCEASFKLIPEDETLSHFKSCRIKPAVGYGIGYLVDVHLYLHKLFVGRSAAEGDAEGKNARGQERPAVSVLEIVQERAGSRRGSWACFDYTPHGTLRDVQ